MRLLKWLIAVVVLILLVGLVAMPMMREQTKKHSPEKTASYSKNGLNLAVNYSSPSKKGRVIFGELVPYGKVWRTGANEPTTFTTKSAVKIIDKDLPAGTYSLWTLPNKENWQIIFNGEVPDWGVTLMSGGKETTRNPSADVIQVDVPSRKTEQPIENFTIEFQDSGQLSMVISWDDTLINIPINK